MTKSVTEVSSPRKSNGQIVESQKVKKEAKILNHADSGVTAAYDRHSYDREKREAFERWGDRAEEIVGGR